MGFRDDFSWSNRFLPEIKAILGVNFIGPPPEVEDTQRNTDLIVLHMEPLRFACRIRKFNYHEKYSHEFTVRSQRQSGQETELSKIIKRWGDYIFYGFANREETGLYGWKIGDLNTFRLWHSTQQYHLPAGHLPGKEMFNKDNSSVFRVYEWDKINGFCIAESNGVQEQQCHSIKHN